MNCPSKLKEGNKGSKSKSGLHPQFSQEDCAILYFSSHHCPTYNKGCTGVCRLFLKNVTMKNNLLYAPSPFQLPKQTATSYFATISSCCLDPAKCFQWEVSVSHSAVMKVIRLIFGLRTINKLSSAFVKTIPNLRRGLQSLDSRQKETECCSCAHCFLMVSRQHLPLFISLMYEISPCITQQISILKRAFKLYLSNLQACQLWPFLAIILCKSHQHFSQQTQKDPLCKQSYIYLFFYSQGFYQEHSHDY